jgi:hypothetical protein
MRTRNLATLLDLPFLVESRGLQRVVNGDSIP